ncbi:MAG: Tol-Pal system subunit TolQ [Pseudomonadota bacterium]|nr:MAG: Tol-Pal system subunit TolQ [Pseudomonadota bacterium]
MVRRNEHSRDGTEWQFDCKAGAAFLALMSALSWAIIIIKALQYHNIRKEAQKILSNLPERVQPESNQKSFFRVSFFCFFIHFFCHLSGGSANESTNSAFFSGLSESNSMLPYLSQQLQRVIEKAINERYSFIENRLNILATISSAAPFIGLFGTVLGIINSFQSIGTTGVTSLASVAPGISEGSGCNCAGLLAAIPALMAYNYFRNQARLLTNTMRNFGMDITNRFEWIVNGRLLGRE